MVWSDTGDEIRAYCVPDSYSGYCKLNIFVDGALHRTMAPNDFNEYMTGRHETGNVGFRINGDVITNIKDVIDLEIRDVDTDILVYRRPPNRPTINMNIFRLETHIFPLWRLDNAFKDKFRFWYSGIDKLAAETGRQILEFHRFGSLYSSGRILFSNHDYYLSDHQKTIMMVQEPYEELAERLLIFKRLGDNAKDLLGDRDVLIFSPIIELIGQLEDFSEKGLRSSLGSADKATVSRLSNPVTRLLTASTPDEFINSATLGKALQAVSEFAVVGVRAQSDHFLDALAALLGVSREILPELRQFEHVREVAEILRSIRWIEGLLESDLEFYQRLTSAIQSVNS